MTCPGAPARDDGPAVDDSNHLLRCWMIWWTLQCAHCRHHGSPDQSRHPDTSMKSGILVIRNTMHEGK